VDLIHYSPTDSRRGILLPEHMVHQIHPEALLLTTTTNDMENEAIMSSISIVKQVVNDVGIITNPAKKTPLVVNRELYRAHRRMRLAVLEASKRFEEQQIMREGLGDVNVNVVPSVDATANPKSTNMPPPEPKDTMAGIAATKKSMLPQPLVNVNVNVNMPPRTTTMNVVPEEGVMAGLVMRRGTSERQNSTGAERVRTLLRLREADRQAQLAAATKKSGRSVAAGAGGRRSRRNKTVSDMSVLMAGMPSSPDPVVAVDHNGNDIHDNGNGNGNGNGTPSGGGGHQVGLPSLSQSTSSDLAENGSSSYGTTTNPHHIINMATNSLSWTGPPPDMSSFRWENVSQDELDSNNNHHQESEEKETLKKEYPAFASASQSQPVMTIDENYSLLFSDSSKHSEEKHE
jgi:hypothetical protein